MKKKKIIINIFLMLAAIVVMLWLIMENRKDRNIEKVRQKAYLEYTAEKQGTEQNTIKDNSENKNSTNENNTIKDEITEENTEKIKQYPKEEIAEQYQGYTVCAKLEIPKISLETYILKKYSVQALNVAVTKFWGADPNQVGNFCVAGHNFPNRNMFYKLKKLDIGDNFFVSDNNIGKVEYEIYDLYKVQPNDVSCLSQETQGRREVTLITCTIDSKERIIVKGREI